MKNCPLLTLDDPARDARVRMLDDHPSAGYQKARRMLRTNYWKYWFLFVLLDIALCVGVAALPMPRFFGNAFAALEMPVAFVLFFVGPFYCLLQTANRPLQWTQNIFYPTLTAAFEGSGFLGVTQDIPEERSLTDIFPRTNRMLKRQRLRMADGTVMGQYTGMGVYGAGRREGRQKVYDAVACCVPWKTGLTGTVIVRTELGERVSQKVADIARGRRVETESVQLNDAYDVASDDPTEARIVLRPDVMDFFNRLEESGRHVTVWCGPDFVWIVDFGSRAYDGMWKLCQGRDTCAAEWAFVRKELGVITDIIGELRRVLAEE